MMCSTKRLIKVDVDDFNGVIFQFRSRISKQILSRPVWDFFLSGLDRSIKEAHESWGWKNWLIWVSPQNGWVHSVTWFFMSGWYNDVWNICKYKHFHTFVYVWYIILHSIHSIDSWTALDSGCNLQHFTLERYPETLTQRHGNVFRPDWGPSSNRNQHIGFVVTASVFGDLRGWNWFASYSKTSRIQL